MAAIGISQSSSFTPDSTKAKAAAASIFSIIDRKSKIDPSDESGMTPPEVKGEIELHHISFKYPSRPDIQIFRDLSLAIHSGKVKGVHKSMHIHTRNWQKQRMLPDNVTFVSSFRLLLWWGRAGAGNRQLSLYCSDFMTLIQAISRSTGSIFRSYN